MAAATHKTISTTFSSHCFNYRYIVQAPRRSQAVLESLTQIPVNVERNEWSLRKSFFRTTSRDADPCFLPVRESPPLRYCCYFDFVSLFNHIIHSPLSFQTRHRKATIVEVVSRNAQKFLISVIIVSLKERKIYNVEYNRRILKKGKVIQKPANFHNSSSY